MINALKHSVGNVETTREHRAELNGQKAAPAHETSPSAVTFQTLEELHTVPYSYIKFMRFRKGVIYIRTTDARIEISGQRLHTVYSLLTRFKMANLSLDSAQPDDAEQPCITTITIHYDDEEENHERESEQQPDQPPAPYRSGADQSNAHGG